MTGEGAATAAVAEGVTAVRRGVVVERGGAGRACTAERQALRLCVRRLCSSSESEHIARHEKSAGGSRTAIIRKSSVYPTQYDGPKTTRCSNATYGPHRGGGGGGQGATRGRQGRPGGGKKRWSEMPFIGDTREVGARDRARAKAQTGRGDRGACVGA